MEMQGLAMRGTFEYPKPADDALPTSSSGASAASSTAFTASPSAPSASRSSP